MAKKQIYLTSFSLNTPKTLITGTDGFIGFHLANALLAKSHTIVGLDNINDYYDVKLKYDRLSQAGIHISQAETHPDPDTSGQPTTNNPTAPSGAHGQPPQPSSHENQQPPNHQPEWRSHD